MRAQEGGCVGGNRSVLRAKRAIAPVHLPPKQPTDQRRRTRKDARNERTCGLASGGYLPDFGACMVFA